MSMREGGHMLHFVRAEYHVEIIPLDPAVSTARLNYLGQQGWHLVHVHVLPMPTPGIHVVLTRPAVPSPGEIEELKHQITAGSSNYHLVPERR